MYCVNHGPPPLPRLLWGFAGTPFLFLFLSLLPLLSVGSYFRWSTFLGSKFSGEAFVSVCSRYCCGGGEGGMENEGFVCFVFSLPFP